MAFEPSMDPEAPEFNPRAHPQLFPQAKSPEQVKKASLKYAKYMMGSGTPCPLEEFSSKAVEISTMAVEQSSEKALAAHALRASHGDAASCIHIGLCKLFGLGTPLVYQQAREFFWKAVGIASRCNPPDRQIASKASALLLSSLYMAPHTTENLDFLHKDIVKIGLSIAGDSVHFLQGKVIPDFVYSFCNYWEPRMKTWPEYRAHPGEWGTPALWKLVRERRAEKKKAEEKLAKKVSAKPNRYRCAALGCTIEAESGKALKRCSGKCPEDSKPHYCSPECQKKDWSRHKSFCRPDAPASQPKAPPTKGVDYDIEVFFKGMNNSDADIVRTITSTGGKKYRIKGPKEGVMNITSIMDSMAALSMESPQK